jgi:hypothetical protein
MTARREVEAVTGQQVVIFELAGDVHEGIVSVVGSFNQWTPGIHVLELQEDGQRNVTVPVEPDVDIHFRYLGSGGVWFDDPEAETTEYGSILRRSETEPSAAAEPATELNPPPAETAAKRGRSGSTPRQSRSSRTA